MLRRFFIEHVITMYWNFSVHGLFKLFTFYIFVILVSFKFLGSI
jgi:hypothetical protein